MQADLQGTGNGGKELCCLGIKKFITDFKVKVDPRCLLPDHFQDGFCPREILIEGGIEDKDLADAMAHEIIEFRRDTIERKASHRPCPHAIKTKFAGKGAAARQLPQDSLRDVGIKLPGKPGGRERFQGERGGWADTLSGLAAEQAGEIVEGQVVPEALQEFRQCPFAFADDQEVKGCLCHDPGRIGSHFRPTAEEDDSGRKCPQLLHQMRHLGTIPDVSTEADDLRPACGNLCHHRLGRGAADIVGHGDSDRRIMVKMSANAGLEKGGSEGDRLRRALDVKGDKMKMHGACVFAI